MSVLRFKFTHFIGSELTATMGVNVTMNSPDNFDLFQTGKDGESWEQWFNPRVEVMNPLVNLVVEN